MIDQPASMYLADDLLRQVFGENVLMPAVWAGRERVSLLGRYVEAVTPAVASLRAELGVPTLAEELAHLLGTIEHYLEDIAPGAVKRRKWVALIVEGKASTAYDDLRAEATRALKQTQFSRTIKDKNLGDVTPRALLLHLADHTAHHRGRLALLMRLCGVEPPAL